MSEVACPVEGCDYEDQLSSVRSHVNAKPDHPAWSDVKDQVIGDDGPVEQGRDGPVEQGRDGPVEGADGPLEASQAAKRSATSGGDGPLLGGGGEGADDGARNVDNPPSEQSEASELPNSDMASDDEYHDQHDQATEGGESPDGDGDGEATDRTPGGIGIGPLDRQTLLLLGAAFLVAVVVFSLLRRRKSNDGSATAGQPAPESDDEEDLQADSGGPGELQGGLVKEETHA